MSSGPSIQRGTDIEPGGCPGGAEYGRGLSRTVVHGDGCCERWAETSRAERVEQLVAKGYRREVAERIQAAVDMEPIPQQAGHVYTGICPVDGMDHS